jgi:predicted Zn-dependent protease with MMP-like domain
LLLGVYIGTPRPFKHPHSTVLSMPDRIELYQNNIEVVCSTPEEIKRQVQATVKHEIGHYFGMSERDLRRI